MTDDRTISVVTRMSDRLLQIAEMLREGTTSSLSDNELNVAQNSYDTVADVGCDHGYISIYLVQSGIAPKAIAMDVRKGPLDGAKSNISEYSLTDHIETRLSDGLSSLNPGEADALVIAGMGGKLMMRILEDGDPKGLGIKRAILQPQSDIDEFRSYLRAKGYSILDEKVILDEGKYYFPIKVSFSGEAPVGRLGRERDYLSEAVALLTGKTGCSTETATNICNRFGECNLLRGDELLQSYLKHGAEVTRSIMTELSNAGHSKRYDELNEELAETEAALKLYLE
ncbi:class I SAM-dependent methyltransferase [Butyrivibrio sp. VCB2006]|uniref:class I SAM-dependent methyltransferase n=1 Tax=Butyrivibrio sp. VCB2006 TaxID=1280679 RepID=UPI00040974FC|nr:class I SAM-dependent methyltransferase [Butyrivibrio sp. VCB2006]